MRILQVIHGLPPYSIGGTETYTVDLSQELAKRHKVFIFHRVNDLSKEEYALGNKTCDKFEIFTVNNTFREYDSFEATYKNKIVAEKFGSVLDEVKPDLVHIQSLLYLGARLIEEIKKRKIPIVCTLHDYWLICPQGQFLKNNQLACNKKDDIECLPCVSYLLSIKKGVFNIYYFLLKKFMPYSFINLAKKMYLRYSQVRLLNHAGAFKLIEDRNNYVKDICREVDLFISPSQFLKNKFVDFGIPENKIAFLQYGFDSEKFGSSFKTPSNRIGFGFIGSFIPAKGLHLLIEAFNKIKDDKTELKIYGKAVSYKGLLFNYSKRIKKMVKNKNIKFMGEFENKNIARILWGIDVLVVPSIWNENSPLVIQEAFATKTPVIASDIGGIPELIVNGVNGILFNPNDVNGLYEKINQIIQNPRLIESLKQNINPPKSIEQNAEEIEDIYEGLLNRCQKILAS